MSNALQPFLVIDPLSVSPD